MRAVRDILRGMKELPLKVFVEGGYLKYWSSKTFIFDRKGNFLRLTSSEIDNLTKKNLLSLKSPSFC